jgi:hypothetical protein
MEKVPMSVRADRLAPTRFWDVRDTLGLWT